MFIGKEEVEFIKDRNTITVIINDLIIDSDYYFVKNNLLGNCEYKYAMKAIYKFLIKNKTYPVCYIDFYGDE